MSFSRASLLDTFDEKKNPMNMYMRLLTFFSSIYDFIFYSIVDVFLYSFDGYLSH